MNSSLNHSTLLKIDILSDVVCPWCVIGYKRLQKAIQELQLEDKVCIEWHPFELNPQMSPEGENLRSHLAAKYGTTLEGSIAARKHLTELGAELGFRFNYFDEMRMYNTRKAHLLIHLAKEKGLQTVMSEALFEAYFSNQKDISDTEELVKVAVQVGFNEAEVCYVLNDRSLTEMLQSLQGKWLSNDFNGVPAFIFNYGVTLTGAQEINTFKSVLTRVIAEELV
ncbi:DsbA family oxidoreductase [Litoribrevibacter euphylliae]|uniref:DsbA family oxidoreductase n=1 Tax=Litoribrevibacter euphylliae TaxID=1834034 RepID=A0ABV7HBZ4_9GAMM